MGEPWRPDPNAKRAIVIQGEQFDEWLQEYWKEVAAQHQAEEEAIKRRKIELAGWLEQMQPDENYTQLSLFTGEI